MNGDCYQTRNPFLKRFDQKTNSEAENYFTSMISISTDSSSLALKIAKYLQFYGIQNVLWGGLHQ